MLKYGRSILVITALLILQGEALGMQERAKKTEKPEHHTKNGFKNIYPFELKGILKLLKWRWQQPEKSRLDPDRYNFPTVKTDTEFLRNNRTETTLTWIGHATVLLQLNGVNILTDPQFSMRASPFDSMGPPRILEPVPPLSELPAIDAVVLSHDHYDSLDLDSVIGLHKRKGGDKTLFFVPLKLKKWFKEVGITNVVELDWWEEKEYMGLNFICLPAHHWSKRTPIGTNKTLWSGWAVTSPDFRFYFAGDTGYVPIFKEIGKRYGPFDLAAIPIGAYDPEWFMKVAHVDPEEAVEIHKDVKARNSVAIRKSVV